MVHVDKYDHASDLISDLRERGMQVWMLDDHIAIDPHDKLTSEDREQISLRRPDIMPELWKEKRCDPALKHTPARTLERDLTAQPGVLEARVWDYQEEWSLQIDYDMSADRVHETDLEIRNTLSKAVNTLYEQSTGRVRIREASWWRYDHGEPPSYTLSVEGLDLEAVVAEAQCLLEEDRANMEAFREMVLAPD